MKNIWFKKLSIVGLLVIVSILVMIILVACEPTIEKKDIAAIDVSVEYDGNAKIYGEIEGTEDWSFMKMEYMFEGSSEYVLHPPSQVGDHKVLISAPLYNSKEVMLKITTSYIIEEGVITGLHDAEEHNLIPASYHGESVHSINGLVIEGNAVDYYIPENIKSIEKLTLPEGSSLYFTAGTTKLPNNDGLQGVELHLINSNNVIAFDYFENLSDIDELCMHETEGDLSESLKHSSIKKLHISSHSENTSDGIELNYVVPENIDVLLIDVSSEHGLKITVDQPYVKYLVLENVLNDKEKIIEFNHDLSTTFLNLEKIEFDRNVNVGSSISLAKLQVSFTDKVTEIMPRMFYNKQLGGIVFGENITEIGEESFFGNSGVENIVLPVNINKFGIRAFAQNSIIKTFVDNSYATRYPESFLSGVLLEKVEINSPIIQIDDYAFGYADLEESQLIAVDIVIPASVITLGEAVFHPLVNLTCLGDDFKMENKMLFSADKNELIMAFFTSEFVDGTPLAVQLNLPNEVKSIRNHALNPSCMYIIKLSDSLETLEFNVRYPVELVVDKNVVKMPIISNKNIISKICFISTVLPDDISGLANIDMTTLSSIEVPSGSKSKYQEIFKELDNGAQLVQKIVEV